MIRELSRAIELSGREDGEDLEARGIWGGLGCGGVGGKPLAFSMAFPAFLSPSVPFPSMVPKPSARVRKSAKK